MIDIENFNVAWQISLLRFFLPNSHNIKVFSVQKPNVERGSRIGKRVQNTYKYIGNSNIITT